MDSNLQKYQALLKTVECGSFTKAAEALGYTQSSVQRTAWVASIRADIQNR